MTANALIANSPIASVISDPQQVDNPIIACNAKFLELTGYSESEVIGHNCRFLSGPKTEPWLSEEIRNGLRGKKSVLVEIQNYKRDGTPFRNAVLIAPIFDEHGDIKYFIGSQVEVDQESNHTLIRRRSEAVRRLGLVTPRQRDVLQFIARGVSNKIIAYNLNLSEKTVKMHRAMLLERLGVTTTADAIRLAVEAGL